MNKRSIGSVMEDRAAAFLASKGFEIVCRNYASKLGEIDIIAKKDDVIHFVEVKYRQNSDYGSAEEAVSYSKINKLKRTAALYYRTHYLEMCDYCFDLIAINNDKISYFEDAF